MNIDFEWITVPAGSFLMGTSSNKSQEMALELGSKYFLKESPPTEIFVDSFQISSFPVTNSQYKDFIDATGYKSGAWSSFYSDNALDHPATHLNYYDALAFCKWANCRLPTCIEWEKSARGPQGFEYPWGPDWNSLFCNNRENSQTMSTTPVDYFPQGISYYGLHDMAGNVWEWTSSTLESNRTPAIWWAWNSPKWNMPARENKSIDGYDYIYPERRIWRVLKGGGVDSNRWGLRCAFQLTGYTEEVQGDFFGFRCVKA